MALLNPVANPLLGRLWCYRFALVQCDVRRTLAVASWGLPQVSRHLTPHTPPIWRRVLAGLPEYQGQKEGVVLSPCLAALRELRQNHPRLALILLQTPFEPPPPASSLRRCVGIIRYPGLCRPEDPLQPLRRLPAAKAPAGVFLEAYRRYGFPLLDLAEAIQDLAPNCRVHAAENGLLQVQLSLMNPYQAEHERPWRQKRRAFDALLASQWFRLPFPRLVVARNAERCRHFRGDVLRVLGWRHRPIDLEAWRDGLPHPERTCVLAEDRHLLFRDLQNLFIVHLDEDRHAFRTARTLPFGDEQWLETESVNALSLIQIGGRRLCLVRGDRGWSLATQSVFARDLPLVDQQERLTHLRQLFRWRHETPQSIMPHRTVEKAG